MLLLDTPVAIRHNSCYLARLLLLDMSTIWHQSVCSYLTCLSPVDTFITNLMMSLQQVEEACNSLRFRQLRVALDLLDALTNNNTSHLTSAQVLRNILIFCFLLQ